MLYKYILITTVLVFFGCSSVPPVKNECNEPEGYRLIDKGEFKGALFELESCKIDENTSLKTLTYLGYIYGWKGLGKFPSSHRRWTKVYNLLSLAALKGDPGSIDHLINIYRDGDPLTRIKSNKIKAACLEKALDSRHSRAELVERCLQK